MLERLMEIAKAIEKAEKSAHCSIIEWDCQIVVTFDKRPDTEIALLTPYTKAQIKKGYLDSDTFTEILFTIKRIANWSVA